MEPVRKERDMRTESHGLYAEPAPAISNVRRISWGALFAGVAVAFAVQLWLSILGIAIGASTFNPATGGASGTAIGIGAGIWFVVSASLALFAGGWVAGRLSNSYRPFETGLHGFITWALSNALLFLFLTTAIGGLFGTVTNAFGQAVGGGGAVIASQMGGGDGGGAIDQAQQAGRQVTQDLKQSLGGGRGAQQAEQAAGVVSGASWWLAISMLLSAAAATFGGYLGRSKEYARMTTV